MSDDSATCSVGVFRTRPERLPVRSVRRRGICRLLAALLVAAVAGCLPAPPPAERHAVPYVAGATDRQTLDVHLPDTSRDNLRPAVLVLHGGGWRRGDPEQMGSIVDELVAAGFVVVNARYRLVPDAVWPAQFDDARAAWRWMAAHAAELGIDPRRMAVWGYSAGAHLTMLLATDPEPGQPRPHAVVAGGTPADLRVFAESELVNDFLGGTPAQVPERYAAASPLLHVSTDDPPTFLYHGRNDWIVTVEQMHALADALRAAGVAVETREATFGHIAVFVFERDLRAEAIRFITAAPPQP